MRMSRLLCVLLACPVASAPILADDPIDCTNANTTVEMNFCSD